MLLLLSSALRCVMTSRRTVAKKKKLLPLGLSSSSASILLLCRRLLDWVGGPPQGAVADPPNIDSRKVVLQDCPDGVERVPAVPKDPPLVVEPVSL